MHTGLYQGLTGLFRNGVPTGAVSSRTQRVLTIMDAIWDIINTQTGTFLHSPAYGIPDVLPDTMGAVPKRELKIVTDHLKIYLPVFVPNIKNVYIVQWDVNPKGCFCECILICRLKDHSVYRYFVQFRGIGNNYIQPWRGVV